MICAPPRSTMLHIKDKKNQKKKAYVQKSLGFSLQRFHKRTWIAQRHKIFPFPLKHQSSNTFKANHQYFRQRWGNPLWTGSTNSLQQTNDEGRDGRVAQWQQTEGEIAGKYLDTFFGVSWCLLSLPLILMKVLLSLQNYLNPYWLEIFSIKQIWRKHRYLFISLFS